jgi:nucleoside-diphosphate-sugar epimerase
MNVLLVGGTGFVGRSMQARAPEGTAIDVVTRHVGNGAGDYTHIVHMAHGPSTRENINVTDYVTSVARRCGARVLLCSSGAAGEDNLYGATKALQEQMLSCAVVARLYSFISRELPEHHAVRQFIDTAERGEDVVVTGSGNAVRSYLHWTQMADELWWILEHGDQRMYEVGSCVPVSIMQIAGAVANLYGVGVKVLGGNDGTRLYYVARNGVFPYPGLYQSLLMEAER